MIGPPRIIAHTDVVTGMTVIGIAAALGAGAGALTVIRFIIVFICCPATCTSCCCTD